MSSEKNLVVNHWTDETNVTEHQMLYWNGMNRLSCCLLAFAPFSNRDIALSDSVALHWRTTEVICMHLLHARSKCRLAPTEHDAFHSLLNTVCLFLFIFSPLSRFPYPQTPYITLSTSSVIPYLPAWNMNPFHEESILLIFSWPHDLCVQLQFETGLDKQVGES